MKRQLFRVHETKVHLNEQKRQYLILVSSSTSSLVQPRVQPEKASISISYLRWRTKNGPLFLSIWTTFLPSSSIWEVNFRALKFTRHRNFWTSIGSPLLESRASVLFKCRTLYFWTNGRICSRTRPKDHPSSKRNLNRKNSKNLSYHEHESNLIKVIWHVWPTNRWQRVNHSRLKSSFKPWR